MTDTNQKLYADAKKIIPGGVQLLSKRPEMWAPELWPAYYSKAKGCEIWDIDGNHFYDTSLMGIGACVLGYAFDEVDSVAKQTIDNGAMTTLNAPEEYYLAKKLIDLHPWAEKVRYAKAGGEAMALATRIVRAYTQKDIVLVCGYHGWHDWYLAANLIEGDPLGGVHLKGLEPAGVPRSMAGTNLIFHYNKIDEFRELMKNNKGKIAAVIMEPIRNTWPLEGFLEEVREETEKEGILLVFDEITSGFRLCTGGSHLKLGITPDVAVFAKALTNGYPLSAVIGRGEVMNAAQNTFISSTFFTERIGFAATLKSIECYEKYSVDKHINRLGKRVQDEWGKICKRHHINAKITGIYPLSHFNFACEDSLAYKTFFTQEMLKKGFLASNGFYLSFGHNDEVIDMYFEAFEEVIEKIERINRHGENIRSYVKKVCQSGFQRLI